MIGVTPKTSLTLNPLTYFTLSVSVLRACAHVCVCVCVCVRACVCVPYLCGGSIEGDAQQRAESQTGRHGQSYQQDPRQPHCTLGLCAIPPQHGQTRIGQLEVENKHNATQIYSESTWPK